MERNAARGAENISNDVIISSSLKSRSSLMSLMESTKALGKYLWVFEHAASQVRHLPNVEKHYDAACAKWATLGLVLPPSGDQQKRKEFFNFCDSECQKIPSESTPEGNFLIVFAASAAAQVVIDHDMIHMDEESRGKAFKAVNDYVSVVSMISPASGPNHLPSLASSNTLSFMARLQPLFKLTATSSIPLNPPKLKCLLEGSFLIKTTQPR